MFNFALDIESSPHTYMHASFSWGVGIKKRREFLAYGRANCHLASSARYETLFKTIRAERCFTTKS